MPTAVQKLLGSPIFSPLEHGLRRFSGFNDVPTLEELGVELHDAEVKFVAQGAKTGQFEDGYEPRIHLKGEVQTREHNWHDFFNALVWHRFPKTKRTISALQYQQQKSHYPDKTRTPTENMLTLFDENGAIVIARDPRLLALIREHRWHELFWQHRELTIKQLQVVVFGHALYEKAMNPYVGLTAQCLLFGDIDAEDADSQVAKFLGQSGARLTTNDLDPLPILGIPGWWHDNEEESFYANVRYFRS